MPMKPQMAETLAENPFSQPSTLPYQLPPFDRVKDAHYLPAFEEGMREQRQEVEKITGNSAAADFANTIVALERSGRMLARVGNVFFNLNASNTNPQMQAIDAAIAPRLQAHDDAIYLDPALFARVDAVYRQRAALQLDSESLQL